jgi:hypothetical protein
MKIFRVLGFIVLAFSLTLILIGVYYAMPWVVDADGDALQNSVLGYLFGFSAAPFALLCFSFFRSQNKSVLSEFGFWGSAILVVAGLIILVIGKYQLGV